MQSPFLASLLFRVLVQVLCNQAKFFEKKKKIQAFNSVIFAIFLFLLCIFRAAGLLHVDGGKTVQLQWSLVEKSKQAN